LSALVEVVTGSGSERPAWIGEPICVEAPAAVNLHIVLEDDRAAISAPGKGNN